MSFHLDSNKPCISYTSHCASSRTDSNCTFCNVDTSGFSETDWDSCPEAIRQNIQIQHNYRVAHIQGMAVGEQDFAQLIFYRCGNCGDTYTERDDQR